ncbi:tetratricopeptide repeat protein [Arthrobacter zhangbolii]|uniref:Tetratricopeptide repeat protein n=1 Tax=Arthrobacter zhangbolii TaxID=2886936 RepID=A0A9X1SCH2_9MICC|nr:tetratricopeptide repeat protein [Arthrobacter zhangbolii]MCC3273899.1 tetratricopeptide repeat protein [Arthrobacter zhangbolii]MCC3294662.1 tetratricopeptide repeat protein [Arthrobacter zhangbolii]UON93675.1 tetratricopeptide repeat protein [Arthrobacter zhangbolii]
MDGALEAELDGLFAARDRADMAPTITALLGVLRRHPGNARVLYEVGGAHDTAGREEEAAGYYEQALAAGLSGDVLRRCCLQYGSTLRNLGRMEESLAVFARARQEFPGSVSLGVFEALTLHAAGRADRALAGLLFLMAEHVDSPELQRYVPAIRGNAEYLVSLDEEPPH